MTTLILTSAPTITDRTISLSYVIDRGEKGRSSVTEQMTRADRTTFLPDKKQDAIAGCTIWDACREYVGQERRAAFAAYTKSLSAWTVRLKTLVERGANGKAGDLLTHLRNKPVKPDLPDDVVKRIAPFVAFLGTMQAAWSGARKHTLSMVGVGPAGKTVVWAGTLSSLTRKSPTSGVIAKGRRIF